MHNINATWAINQLLESVLIFKWLIPFDSFLMFTVFDVTSTLTLYNEWKQEGKNGEQFIER